ncbi:MAG: MerR family transcriptional regulator [Myxococcales bacterium]|nr:MerR family transcriptional regulator [Myxococcales bacterium]
MSSVLPDKLFFKIGEVARIVGVRPHVLRYWEEEFPSLRPKKTRGAHRHYSRRDVETAMLIRKLVHEEGYTVAGARRRLRGDRGAHAEARVEASREVALRAELLALREALAEFVAEIDSTRAAPAELPEPELCVEAVVPIPPRRR